MNKLLIISLQTIARISFVLMSTTSDHCTSKTYCLVLKDTALHTTFKVMNYYHLLLYTRTLTKRHKVLILAMVCGYSILR